MSTTVECPLPYPERFHAALAFVNKDANSKSLLSISRSIASEICGRKRAERMVAALLIFPLLPVKRWLVCREIAE